MAFTLCFHITAQQVSQFWSITTKDGLPSNYVMAIEQDASGYLWLGTDKGLVQYDGFRYKTFTTENGLPGNYIGFIKKAGKNGLWLGIGNKGIYYYDIQSGNTAFVVKDFYDHFEQTDSNDNLFFYQRGNIPSVLNGYWVSPLTPEKINHAFEVSLIKGGEKFATDFANKKIILVDVAGNPNYQRIKFNNNDWTVKKSGALLNEPTLYEKISDSVFISQTTLYKLNAIGKAIAFQFFPQQNSYFNTLKTKEGIWINNEKEGLYFLNNQFEKIHFTTADGLASNMVVAMYQMKNGNMLFGTLGGGLCYKLPGTSAQFFTNEPVKGIAQNGNNIYAATNKYLYAFDKAAKKLAASLPLSNVNVQGVNVWDNQVYVSHLTGYTSYLQNGKQFTALNKQLIGAGVSNIVQLNGVLFAATYGNAIQKIINGEKTAITNKMQVPEKLQALSYGMAASNYEDGVEIIKNGEATTTITTKDGLPSNAIYDVQEYKDTLWISTSKGVAAYTNNKVVKTITAANGIKGNRCVFSFYDKNNNFWIATDENLGRWNGSSVITNSTAAIKFNSNDKIISCIYDSTNNTLVTATQQSVFFTQLTENPGGTSSALPLLQYINANGKIITGKNSFSLKASYNDLRFVFTPYNTNPFSKSTLYYQLEGFNNDYIELKDSISLSYPNLRSGNYTLKAKMIDENGIEGNEVLLCIFKVKKPVWQQAWFIAAGVFFLIFITNRITKQNQKRKQLQKEKQLLLEKQLLTERERIGKELHDNLGTSLVTMIAQADNIETKLRSNNAEDALQKATELTDQSRLTMNMLRETIWAVQEKSHSYENFIGRVTEFLQRTYAVTAIECNYESTGRLQKELSPEQTLNLFRCVQEITQNIIKHSGADKATYHFSACNNTLTTTIKDNGKGFNTTVMYNSNGLKNIKSRIKEIGGTIQIQSSSGGGTSITIETIL